MAPFPDFPIPVDEPQRLRDLERHGLEGIAPNPFLRRIVDLASDILDMPIALVSLVDERRQWFFARAGLDATETPRNMAFCAHAIAGDSVLVVPDALEDPRFNTNPLVLEPPHIRFYAGAPLRSLEGHNLGTLCVIDRRPRQFSERQVRQLDALAVLAMRELEWHHVSLLCPITGLHGRTMFFKLGDKELARAREQGRPLSLVNLDIDNFRQVNNRWGHPAGDRVLHDFCQLARTQLGPDDLLARIGDEEFGLLLVDRDDRSAVSLAEALRERAAAMPGIYSGSDYHLRLSGGATALASRDRTFSDLFYRADQALYLAKGNGRDQIALLQA
ncbi:MAG: GGDEF domain-containing protein [Cyanobacteriota bacterium]